MLYGGANNIASLGGEDSDGLPWSQSTAPDLDSDGCYHGVLLPSKYACQSVLLAHTATAAVSFLPTWAHLRLRIFLASKIRDITCSSSEGLERLIKQRKKSNRCVTLIHCRDLYLFNMHLPVLSSLLVLHTSFLVPFTLHQQYFNN